MFTIRKATSADCGLIHKLAWQIFPETYKEILSKEQIEYMMEWMYSLESIANRWKKRGMCTSLPVRSAKRRVMYPYSNKKKTCFTCKRFMCFLIIRAHTAGVSCFAKL